MSEKLIVKTDITDWQEEALQSEFLPENEEAIYKALDNGISSAKITRAVIVAREKQIAPTDIIRSNKLLLHAGGVLDIIRIAHKRKLEVETESGKSYDVPAYVGSVADKDDEKETDNSFVNSDSAEGMRRAIDYMEKIIPGYIWGRLLIIHNFGGDVRNEADKLKQNIDEMINRILE
jgi:hypothetical protein